jgi:hypothetical protein
MRTHPRAFIRWHTAASKDQPRLSEAQVAPITVSDMLAVWRFQRGDESLELEQQETAEGAALRVTGAANVRSFDFDNLQALLKFQEDMQAFLVRTGWHLAEFTPDRRRYRDRRTFPRLLNDRRRWWTDPVPRQ